MSTHYHHDLHWHHREDIEAWDGSPLKWLEHAAIEAFCEESDNGDELRRTLGKDREYSITVFGFELTSDPPPRGREPEGYYPGMQWFRLTEERRTVRIRMSFEVIL